VVGVAADPVKRAVGDADAVVAVLRLVGEQDPTGARAAALGDDDQVEPLRSAAVVADVHPGAVLFGARDEVPVAAVDRVRQRIDEDSGEPAPQDLDLSSRTVLALGLRERGVRRAVLVHVPGARFTGEVLHHGVAETHALEDLAPEPADVDVLAGGPLLRRPLEQRDVEARSVESPRQCGSGDARSGDQDAWAVVRRGRHGWSSARGAASCRLTKSIPSQRYHFTGESTTEGAQHASTLNPRTESATATRTKRRSRAEGSTSKRHLRAHGIELQVCGSASRIRTRT
jgi:hypothetical protein